MMKWLENSDQYATKWAAIMNHKVIFFKQVSNQSANTTFFFKKKKQELETTYKAEKSQSQLASCRDSVLRAIGTHTHVTIIKRKHYCENITASMPNEYHLLGDTTTWLLLQN